MATAEKILYNGSKFARAVAAAAAAGVGLIRDAASHLLIAPRADPGTSRCGQAPAGLEPATPLHVTQRHQI